MKAIILAAGYATRLYPLTLNKPKPLLTVGPKPVIDYIVDNLENVSDIDGIYVITNDKFYPHFLEWAVQKKTKRPIIVLNDHTTTNESRLGAVGDINYVITHARITDDLMVIAGDNLFDYDLRDMVREFYNRRSSMVAVRTVPDKSQIAGKYGVVEANAEGRIIGFEEKPKEPKTDMAATACYLFEKNDVAFIKERLKSGERLDNSGDLIRLLSAERSVFVFRFSGDWIDIGDINEYNQANARYTR